MPNPYNPQSLNRYSYCLNNPLRYIDPTGHNYQDYMRYYGGQVGGSYDVGYVIIIGGSEQPRSELVDLVVEWQNEGKISSKDFVTILEDKWPERIAGFDVSERLEQLYAELALGGSNVKLFGFSEGAATIGAFLWQLGNDPVGTAQRMGSTPMTEIKAAVLFECTNSYLSRNFGDREITNGIKTYQGLDNIPDLLYRVGLKMHLLDAWNTASIVHGGPVKGWNSFSYRSEGAPTGLFSRIWNTNTLHGDILKNREALTAMHDTFYP